MNSSVIPSSTIIAPSLLAAHLGRLADASEMAEKAGVKWLHLDVMDGHFVPNLTFGAPMAAALREATSLDLDAHLMVENPDQHIHDFVKAGVNGITVHWEACVHLHRTLAGIREAGLRAGVAINPHTPVELLRPILGDIDLALVMSVNPGFSGQSFLSLAVDKIAWLAKEREQAGHTYLIQVDGGVDVQTAPLCTQAGADVLVAGSAVFSTGYDQSSVTNAVRGLMAAVGDR